MLDLAILLLAGSAVQTLTRLTDAWAQRWVLRGRVEMIRAVAALPQDAEVAEREREWLARTGPMEGPRR